MVTQKIKLNLIPGGILPRIKASQYDAGARTLVFSLFNGTQAFTIPSGSTVSIRGTKSDHTGFQYECTYSGSEVTAQITDQMTVSPGEVLAELVITKGNDRIATGNFIFENEESALKKDVPISHTDIPAIEHLDDLVDLVEEDTARAETAKTAAETAATQASQSAQAAATSASQASTSATNAASSASAAATSESNSATSETNAGASATQASSSAAAALASQQAAAQSATNAADSESNAATSETNAGNSATAASTSATAAAESEANAADSETAAAGSATSASTSASRAATSATNAASSESNAATSETNAGNSATQAASSAQTANTAATNASTSATNAANSETLARKWAVGDSGSGTATPSDTNNAYYWAQVAQRAAGGGLTIEIVAALPTTDISASKIYLVPSSDPESQNVKDEYVNLDGTTSGWELIGSTKIDLSGYYTKVQVDAIVQDVKDYADSKVAELKEYVQETFTPTTLLKDTVGWTGKNLLPYPYYNTTKTVNGITFTDNGDGTITVNGTNTGTLSQFTFWSDSMGTTPLFIEDFDCIISGCPDGGTHNSFYMVVRGIKEGTTNWTDIALDYGNGARTNLYIQKYEELSVQIRIASGASVNNLTFKPMLRRADIADDTWEPYHKPVEKEIEQLAEDVSELSSDISDISTKLTTVKASYDEDTAIYAHAVGDIVYVNEHFYKVTAAIAVGDTIEENVNVTSETGLGVDTPIYVSNLPGGGAEPTPTPVIPDGETVTPTDNVATWVECAGITKPYTNLTQILEDVVTLSALVSDENAVDYMVRSTSWADTICADQNAMNYIGLNNYCANTLLSDETWLEAICNSEYFESVLNVKIPAMTSNTTPSGECFADSLFSTEHPIYNAFDNNISTVWFSANVVNPNVEATGYAGYKFDKETRVLYVDYSNINNNPSYVTTDVKLSGSKDGENYLEIPFLNSENKKIILDNPYTYLYYKMTITQKWTGAGKAALPAVIELQFYGREDV